MKQFDSSDVDAFEWEVKVLRSLRHPNIVLFMGMAISNDNRCMVTELMHGKSLADLIHNHKNGRRYEFHNSISFRKKLDLLLDVVKGMMYLHGLQPVIVHRDLKPRYVYIFWY